MNTQATIIQGSPEWHALRLGRVTASRVGDVIAKTKAGASASRASYAAELLAERLTGMATPNYPSAAMQWGTLHEADARAAYIALTGKPVVEVAFVSHPAIAMSGASPDGLVGDEGLLEIKCPTSPTHIESLLGGEINPKHIAQMQWQMVATGRQWCDYASYDPRLEKHMQLIVTRVDRDDPLIAVLEAAVIEFLAEIEEKIERLNRIYRPGEDEF